MIGSGPLLVGLLALAVALLIGRPVINALRQARLGKSIREELPETHQRKSGTPTMGGAIFLVPILVVLPFLGSLGTPEQLRGIGVTMGLMGACVLLGLVDDLKVLEGRAREGLPIRVFLLVLLLLAAAAVLVLAWLRLLPPLHVPFSGPISLGPWTVPLAVLVLWATINGVTITDGVDGLLGSTAAVAFAAYGLIAGAQGNGALAGFCFALVGALVGYLWFNAHPAQVFMGNLGSLALGAGLGMAALLTGQWLVLPLIGIIFVAEGLSDVIQIAYFKWTKGKRVFRMTPLHHHFELGGWSETQVTTRFTVVGVLGALGGLLLAMR